MCTIANFSITHIFSDGQVELGRQGRKPFFSKKLILIVKCKKSDTKRHAATAQVGLINPEFQTACGFVGFTTQPTRRITFLCISLCRAVWVLLGNACCKHTEAV